MTAEPTPVTGPETPDALAALQRWEASGATWVLRTRDPHRAVVDLLTCDGGNVVGAVVSSDPAFLAHLDAAPGR